MTAYKKKLKFYKELTENKIPFYEIDPEIKIENGDFNVLFNYADTLGKGYQDVSLSEGEQEEVKFREKILSIAEKNQIKGYFEVYDKEDYLGYDIVFVGYYPEE